ncbi:MAG TPA: nitroreductase family deazaflavin-dependent oxidoreductase [Mycobacteriales bacterium]|nr:nitroreductase family deazaflavin-dependent oxidoreductase [Mycobacteriales bacterium]
MLRYPDFAWKALSRSHRAIFDLTNGQLGNRFLGMQALKLTMTGRKSGQQRQIMLTTPVFDADRVVLVASKGGAPRHPTWYLNLRANPKVTITMGGRSREMLARTATAAEKDGLWPSIVAGYRGYARYQVRAGDRDIPVLILEPVRESIR